MLSGALLVFQACEVKHETGTTSDEKSETEESTDNGTNQTDASENETVEFDGNQDFVMTNNTGMNLVNVFISPYESDDWGNDVIPTDVVRDGETFKFTFTEVSPDQCVWDIMFTGEDGVEYFMRGINLCKTSEITLSSQ